MEIYKKRYGMRVQAALNRLGLTQAWLAEKLNVKPSTVSRWVSGKDFPRAQHLTAITQFIDVLADEVINEPMALAPKQLHPVKMNDQMYAALDVASSLIHRLATAPRDQQVLILAVLDNNRHMLDQLSPEFRSKWCQFLSDQTDDSRHGE